ncbi:MAG: hypothetical protein R3E95_23975 [Thiolinea sp.]
MKKDLWMTEYAVAKHFGLNRGACVRGWGIPCLEVTTASGRTVRRYKRADVLNFERQHMKTLKEAS